VADEELRGERAEPSRSLFVRDLLSELELGDINP
jgi:hypothetical protein